MLFSLKIVLASLRLHRLRTALAVTGVLLGALALTGVQHVGRAM
jgi:putative ABC transport system permease protein